MHNLNRRCTLESRKKELGRVSDGDLDRQYNSLRRLLNGNKFSHQKRVKLETELCYLQREMNVRKARKAAHKKYMEDNPRRRPRQKRQ